MRFVTSIYEIINNFYKLKSSYEPVTILIIYLTAHNKTVTLWFDILMHKFINNDIEIIESHIFKLGQQLHEYVYLNDSYDSEIINTIACNLKSNVDKLFEITNKK